VLCELTEMNSDGPRYGDLEADEDDQIDLETVACTACASNDSTDDNDIVLCDMAGCFRAYHQACLQPPMDASVFEQEGDWFCWQCECLMDCLELVEKEVEGAELESWQASGRQISAVFCGRFFCGHSFSAAQAS
jgi:PHD-finger